MFGADRWDVSPTLVLDYGARVARYDYLPQRSLFSPRAGVTISAFGIEKPQYLGVGVRDQVTVNVSLTASPAESAGATP